MLIKQSTAVVNIPFFMADSADHTTGKTGLTVTVTLSKNCGAFAAASGAITEISSGWYKLAANATDSNTLGFLALHATATGADATDMIVGEVVAFDPQDGVRAGLTALPNAAAGANGGLPLSVDASGRVDVLKVNGTSQTAGDIIGTLGVVSTFTASAGDSSSVTAPAGTKVWAGMLMEFRSGWSGSSDTPKPKQKVASVVLQGDGTLKITPFGSAWVNGNPALGTVVALYADDGLTPAQVTLDSNGLVNARAKAFADRPQLTGTGRVTDVIRPGDLSNSEAGGS